MIYEKGAKRRMNNRITCVSLLDEENIEKIKRIIKELPEPLCKVPYGKKVDDRLKCDTLPYHFTLCAWAIDRKEEVLETLKKMQFSPFKVLVTSVNIVEGKEDSLEVRFSVDKNEELSKLQTYLFERVPVPYYHPEHFHFHITIHCDRNHSKIYQMQEILNKNFVPFELEVEKFGLFEIYPANKILEIPSLK